jgi:tubulin polyglutamylase TTLL6/13
LNSNASKQLLSNVFKKLAAIKDCNIDFLKQQIDNIVEKTVIALDPYLKNAYHCFLSSENQKSKCFQILGLDILVDDNWQLWLMEVNANPSLNVFDERELATGETE